MRDITVIEDHTERPVIKEVFKWEIPKEKTVQQVLDTFCIEKKDN